MIKIIDTRAFFAVLYKINDIPKSEFNHKRKRLTDNKPNE